MHISPETWLLEFNFDNPKNPLVWKKASVMYSNFLSKILYVIIMNAAIGLINHLPSVAEDWCGASLVAHR